MKYTTTRRLPFDPACDFVVLKDCRVAGVAFSAGDAFDKTLVDARRLRQMYEATRLITYAEGQTPAMPPRGRKPGAIGPTELVRPAPPAPAATEAIPVRRQRGLPRIRSRRVPAAA